MATTLSNTDIENLDRFKLALSNDKNLLVREFAIKYGTDREITVSSNNAISKLYVVIIVMLTMIGHSSGLIPL